MFYRIIDISTDDRSGYTCVEVEFWRSASDFRNGLPPVVINDFYNNYNPEQTTVVWAWPGKLRYGGEFLVPYVEQNGEWVPRPNPDLIPIDIVEKIHTDILRWWRIHAPTLTEAEDRRDRGRHPNHAERGALQSTALRGMRGREWGDEP